MFTMPLRHEMLMMPLLLVSHMLLFLLSPLMALCCRWPAIVCHVATPLLLPAATPLPRRYLCCYAMLIQLVTLLMLP